MTTALFASNDPTAQRHLEATLAVLADAGALRVEPPILQPADGFLDTVGEDIRKRLFLTQGIDGATLCLRPDFTIPVCRAHVESGRVEPIVYSYGGRVFRQRSGETGEFLQAGAELLGHEDRAQADAQCLSLTVKALAACGAVPDGIAVGDEDLFSALLDALGLAPTVRQRLRGAFGDRERLRSLADRLVSGAGTDGLTAHAGVLSALAGQDRQGAQALVEDLLSIAGIGTVAGRTPHEIAERFLDQADAARAGLDAQRRAILDAYLSIGGPMPDAVDELGRFFGTLTLEHKLDADAFGRAVAEFRRRMDLIEAAGVDARRLHFSAGFGRAIDYYTGFVFEIAARDGSGRPLAGGGRYDALLTLLGANTPVPAVGFSVWIERLETTR